MKIDVFEKTPSGHPAIKFRTNAYELEIIKGMLDCALTYTPKTKFSSTTIARIRAMHRRLNQKEIIDFIDENTKENK